MIRLVVFLLAVSAAALGLGWLADRPGTLVLHWQGWDIETTVFRAVVMLALALAVLTAIGSVGSAAGALYRLIVGVNRLSRQDRYEHDSELHDRKD